jgi:hypothetical protein
MQHPELSYLIQREIQRDRIHQASARRLLPQLVSIHPLRLLAGRALIEMGSRIAATPRPAARRPAIGGIAIAGRIDR